MSEQPYNTTGAESEDDLDDLLDDALNDFSSQPPQPSGEAAASGSVPGSSNAKDGDGALPLDDAFARELANGMEELMRQMESEGGFERGMEALMQRMGDVGLDNEEPTARSAKAAAAASPFASGSRTPGVGPDNRPLDFQDVIAETMNKLGDSADRLRTKETEQGPEEDALMKEMMRQMEQLADSGEFENVVESMMGQLMTRDLLYEPMNEIAKRYPEFLSENKDKIPQEDYDRYERQYGYVKQIVKRFEDTASSNASTSTSTAQPTEADRDPVIVELMEKMQDCGQPPKEILQQLAPDMDLDADGMPNQPDQCNVM